MSNDNKEVCVMKHNEKFFEQFDAVNRLQELQQNVFWY